MTELPTAPLQDDDASAAARQARVANLGRGRSTTSGRSTKRRHPAQGSRIAAAGLGATTMLGLVGVLGHNARQASAPVPATNPGLVAQPQVVVVVHRAGTPGSVATTVAPSTGAETKLTARPTVRPASSRAQAPAASTSGSN